MTSRRRKKVRAFAAAVVITLVLGACAGDEAGASQGTTKLANPTTGPAVTGKTETGPTETASPPARASAAPDVVEVGMCSDGARWRLEVTVMGDPAQHRPVRDGIKVRFEVHQSPVGHEWRIDFRRMEHNIGPFIGHVFTRRTRVASDSGIFVVQLRYTDWPGWDGLVVKAVDEQTGQVCKAIAWYRN
jgi:hypothetical protein